MAQAIMEEKLYKAGDTAEFSGEYELVDAQGQKTDFDLVTLDEGENFPELKAEQATDLSYRMLATCVDDNCDIDVADTEASDADADADEEAIDSETDDETL